MYEWLRRGTRWHVVSLGVVIAVLAVGCRGSWITEPEPSSAAVYGTARIGTTVASARSIIVGAFASGCSGVAIGSGSAITRADGSYYTVVGVRDGVQGSLCVKAGFPGANAADTIFQSATVRFSKRAPYDSVRVDLTRASP